MDKVSVIGAGQVGSTTALMIAQKEFADVTLIDIVQGLAKGKALDIAEAAPIGGYDSRVFGTEEISEIEGSKVVVVTAGLTRSPGMSRQDLLEKNATIVEGIIKDIARYAPLSIIVMVTNPLDLMTYLALKVSGFPWHRVVGQAGVLDAARFRCFVAAELGVSVEDVSAMVLGGHGDSMVPLPRYTTVSGIPIPELLPSDTINRLVERTRRGGGEMVNLLGTSALYAPGASVALMVEAIARDKKRILPCSVCLHGQYGVEGVCMGVPVKLGATGVEEVIELELTGEELEAFQDSARICREQIDLLKI
ncbi:MAG TPA: malate dehydrogenase [Candidatus Latescibacteria bacterium]|nr:malate dehydrogenase [Candidatus Latescibacterota bacterium]